MTEQPVDLVVGGGVAGIAAAIRLIELGRKPLLVEKRPYLGGRASSFTSQETGELIDNGQHVILGCCTQIAGVLKTLDTYKLVRFSSTINWAMAGGGVARLERSPLPAPMHYVSSLFLLECLTLRERLGIMRAQAAIYLTSDFKRLSLDTMTFEEWLDQRGQSAHAKARFWEPIVVSALNEPINECSASSALDLFKRAFLPTRHAASIGVPTVSLRKLIGDPAARYIADHGGEVRVGTSCRSLQVDDNGLATSATLTDGTQPAVRSVTLAVPAEAAAQLLPKSVHDETPDLAIWSNDRGSPIVCVHLWFDKEVTYLPHAILTDGLPQWFFAHPASEETQIEGGPAQRLVAVISAADAALKLTNKEILAQTTTALASVLPGFAEVTLLFSRVVREPRATFSLTPETEHRRIAQNTSVPNLYIAGDWTDSGWPATLEGAAASAAKIEYE